MGRAEQGRAWQDKTKSGTTNKRHLTQHKKGKGQGAAKGQWATGNGQKTKGKGEDT